VPELQRLHPGHAPAVLAFELANRSYFAAFISDRGDEFFDQFTERYSALLAEQEAGAGAYYALVAEVGVRCRRSHGDALDDHVTFRDVVHRGDLEAGAGGEG
jgi:ribosomal-protein-alanine N-acetyltransferase